MPASPIRKLVPLADDAKARGIHVYHLNIGQPDLPTPQAAIDAIRSIDRKVLEYSPSQGYLSYRTKLVDYYKKYDINLTAESFFPRFVLCTEYASSFTTTELMNLRTAFRDDFLYKCGNVTHKEHHKIDELFSTWEFND
jgi:hypothetical protein